MIPSFNSPEKRHGGGATGNKNPAAISAPVKRGDKTGSSFGIGFKLARGVASERGTDNGWDMGSRARGRDIPSAMLMEERTKALAALNSFPETRGSRRIVVIADRLGKAGLADNHSHGSSPSASLHGVHREDGRGGFGNVRKVFGELRNE